jgi:hypothetical protein
VKRSFGYRRKKAACVENGRGYVQLNIRRHYVETLAKVSAKGIPVAATVPLVFGGSRRGRTQHMTILECPRCFSHRASIVNSKPLSARCADCDSTYKIKTVKPTTPDLEPSDSEPPPKPKRSKRQQQDITPAPPINPRDFGALTDFINDALTKGPEGLRAAERQANIFARRHGLTHFDAHWLAVTPWLQRWANGELESTRSDGSPASSNPDYANRFGQRDSRLRARVAISWRAIWLLNYAMTASKALACRAARVTERTANYHLRSDSAFAKQAGDAKAHCIDLLHARMMQRSLEGDIVPVYWQGVVVGHTRGFDSRLQIEMARAHMPDKFKTPGQALINVETGDKILVMDEATRAKLIERRREKLIAFAKARELPAGQPEP